VNQLTGCFIKLNMKQRKRYPHNPLLGKILLPVDIVLAPEWWFRHEGITFDQDFFFHPIKRVESEQRMEQALYERWGRYGSGKNKDVVRPEIGAVHLAAGFLLSEMLGCRVNYCENHPPQVVCAGRDDLVINEDDVFSSTVFKRFTNLIESLREKFGYLTGDVNWGGILNLAMDLKGDSIFMDMMMKPEETKVYFSKIACIIKRFTTAVFRETGTTSVSVNRNVFNLRNPVFLHSECTHTMISEEDYRNFLLPFDIEWSKTVRPFGIHHCGHDPHRMAESYSMIPHLDFLDVGWGGDVKRLRQYLPDTFLNIRLSPVEIARQNPNEIKESIIKRVRDSGNPYLTGVCCINIDDTVSDEKIDTIFETVDALRKEFSNE